MFVLMTFGLIQYVKQNGILMFIDAKILRTSNLANYIATQNINSTREEKKNVNMLSV